MAKYKEKTEVTQSTTTEYVRAGTITFYNPLSSLPKVSFTEDRVVDKDGKILVNETVGLLEKEFTPQNQNTSFDLLNPLTGDVAGSMTYEEVYSILYSLYFHLALERDGA